MENDTGFSADYRRGLLYFAGLALCVFAFFTTPDGLSMFHNFLGLFGIAPGIQMRGGGTLYIFMLVPLIAGIFCFKKMRMYWKNFRERFNLLEHLIAIGIAVFVLFMSNSVVTPSGIDRAFFAIQRQRSGLQAITFHDINSGLHGVNIGGLPGLSYKSAGDYRIFYYNFWLQNHGSEPAEFYVKLRFEDWNLSRDGSTERIPQEVFVTDSYGERKVFTVLQRHQRHFLGDFTAENPSHGMTHGSVFLHDFSVVLVNENDQHTPRVLVRRGW
ncbi:MAG: hypothetical protein FWB96_07065 [Defluviitaleaceae bacterium]|nr:hypothetical protein [Defluviitaleaceae bacterium]MCL2264018.1 hypothetical protein [Defluviitaleaceae bacterium]